MAVRERVPAIEGHFEGNLLVWRPFRIDVIAVLVADRLQDLRRRRAGVSGADADAGFVNAAGGRFISRKKLFHDLNSSIIFSKAGRDRTIMS